MQNEIDDLKSEMRGLASVSKFLAEALKDKFPDGEIASKVMLDFINSPIKIKK